MIFHADNFHSADPNYQLPWRKLIVCLTKHPGIDELLRNFLALLARDSDCVPVIVRPKKLRPGLFSGSSYSSGYLPLAAAVEPDGAGGTAGRRRSGAIPGRGGAPDAAVAKAQQQRRRKWLPEAAVRAALQHWRWPWSTAAANWRLPQVHCCCRQLAPSSGTLIANIRTACALLMRLGCPDDLVSCPTALPFTTQSCSLLSLMHPSVMMEVISLVVQLRNNTAGCLSAD